MRERKQPVSQERRKKMRGDDFDWDIDNQSRQSRQSSRMQSSGNQGSRPYGTSGNRQQDGRGYANSRSSQNDRMYQNGDRGYRDEYGAQSNRDYRDDRAPQRGYSNGYQAQGSRNAQGNRQYQSNRSNYGNPPERQIRDDYHRNNQNRRKKHTVGKVFAIIQGILSIAILAILFIMDVLPTMYLVAGAAVLLFLWLFAFFSQFTKKSHIPGKVFSVLMSALLCFAGYYLLVTQNMLSQITNFKYSIDNMVVVVLQDDPAQSLEDAKNYTFGVRTSYDGENLTHTLEEIKKNVGQDVVTLDYTNLNEQVDALYNHQVGAIIYNENITGTIEESYPEFSTQTRQLDNVEIKTKVEVEDTSDVSVTKEPFIVYISGNDSYGELSLKGRSDVNMLVAVNPQTKQILMVNTPRDFYTEFPGVTNGVKDKLTHSGNYGIDCTMDTLESIYGCNIDYYVRVNFSSVINMVDALGGVTVYSDYDFTAIDGRHFNQGANQLDGESALMFARERKAFTDGDFQRGRDQQLLLTAMIEKAMSPAILTGYVGLMSTLQDNFATNMPQDSITGLIKMQLSDGSDWNIVTVAASGTPDMQYCYSLGGNASVVIPDEASVAKCQDMINRLFNGEILQSPSAETDTTGTN